MENYYSIERYYPDEIDVLYSIIEECGLDMKKRFDLAHWCPPYPIETMRINAEQNNVFGVLRLRGEDAPEVVGTFTIGATGWKYDSMLWENPNHHPLYLGKLAIRPKYQGQGIGSWCMAKIEKLARHWGCQAIRFDAITHHSILLQFYQNLGYTPRGNRCVQDWLTREWEITYFEKVLASESTRLGNRPVSISRL